ncbi:FAD-binding oxidoreductase [Acetobacterium tundrae]|uniref:FAD-binding protein n=1 Tax=Acetobacterium tundrae TaxID=132932 RepID=A0ABR6WMA0_9FIRM|nr:FAD-binding oxidoreductase [Acetobacterium tundrae]MBC3797557.1 FAD-binding protein [Acetobacterium tundrae]
MNQNIISEAAEVLRSKIGATKVLTDEFIRASYNHDISLYAYDYSIPGMIILPESVEDVQTIVEEANRLHIPVVAIGGNTFGNGNIESNQGIVVDFSKMNKILEIDESNMTFTVEGGANIHAVNETLHKMGYCYPTYPLCFGPITFGSEVSKNSGGEVGSMFGHVAKRVIGLEAVVGTGDVIVTGSSNTLKTSPNFIQSSLPDLTGVFISAEGAFGLITKVTMQMQVVPKYTAGADVKFEPTKEGFKAACEFVNELRNYKGLICNAHLLDCYSGWLDERFFTGSTDISAEVEEEALQRAGHIVLLEFEGYTSQEECDRKVTDALKIAESHSGVYTGTMMSDIFARAEHGDLKLTEIVYAGGFVGCMIMTNTPYEKMPELYAAWLKNVEELGLPKPYTSMIVAMGDDCCMPFYYPWHPRRELSEEAEWNATMEKWRELANRTYEDALETGSVPYAVSRKWKPYLLDKLDKGYLSYIQGVKKLFDPNNIFNPGVSVFEEAEHESN